MKKPRLSKKFLEEFARVPIVSVVCEKLNISRQTVYRWLKEDPEFKKLYDEAIDSGTDSINDLAESKLITNISKGEPRAIEFWLTNHKREYYRPKKPLSIETDDYKGVASISITTIKKCSECGKIHDAENGEHSVLESN